MKRIEAGSTNVMPPAVFLLVIYCCFNQIQKLFVLKVIIIRVRTQSTNSLCHIIFLRLKG